MPVEWDSFFRSYVEWFTPKGMAGHIQENLANLRLEHLAQKRAILDIGCGNGKLIQELSKIYPDAKIFGLDSDPYADDNARKNSSVEVKRGSFQSMPFDDSTIDIAVSFNILDYADEKKPPLAGWSNPLISPTFKIEEFEREVYRVLVPGGLYILMEYKIKTFFSYEHWNMFMKDFKTLPALDPDHCKIFQKN